MSGRNTTMQSVPLAYKIISNAVVVSLFFAWMGVTSSILPWICTRSVPVETIIQTEDLRRKVVQVSAELETLKRQHISLSRSWRGRPEQKYLEYEELRRSIYSNTKRLWSYMSRELDHSGRNVAIDKIQEVLEGIYQRKTMLLSDLEKFQNADAWSGWREREAARVSELVQGRLHHLQNPQNCREAKKLYCKRSTMCGLGCQLHHVVYCLIFAYATERTLVLMPLQNYWEKETLFPYIQPISHNCTSIYGDRRQLWRGDNSPKILELDYKPVLDFVPLTVPSDLGHTVKRFNGDPASWWVGQILRFILKPNPHVQAAIDRSRSEIDFSMPIVGIHVRRTDKVGTEASFHGIEEYMSHVQEYYDQLELTTPVEARRVYVATDDVNLLEEARYKYPEYQFLGNQTVVESAALQYRRLGPSLTGMLLDLHSLSMCDDVVGTFSSQMGRAVYELMQANRIDASNSFFSLDDIYYFAGQNNHNRRAVISHRSENMSFETFMKNIFHYASSFEFVMRILRYEVGDLIGVAGNHWDGYGLGTNYRTREQGLFPWYKTSDVLVMLHFPEHKEIIQNQQTYRSQTPWSSLGSSGQTDRWLDDETLWPEDDSPSTKPERRRLSYFEIEALRRRLKLKRTHKAPNLPVLFENKDFRREG